MATVDSYNNVFEVLHLSPVARTGSASGASIDTAGFESVNFILAYGTAGGTGAITPSLQDSPDGVVFTTVANTATIVNQLGTVVPVTVANDDRAFRLGYVGPNRYVKCLMAQAATNVSTFSVVCELGTPHVAPTATNA